MALTLLLFIVFYSHHYGLVCIVHSSILISCAYARTHTHTCIYTHIFLHIYVCSVLLTFVDFVSHYFFGLDIHRALSHRSSSHWSLVLVMLISFLDVIGFILLFSYVRGVLLPVRFVGNNFEVWNKLTWVLSSGRNTHLLKKQSLYSNRIII